MDTKQHILILNSDGTLFAHDWDTLRNITALLDRCEVVYEVYSPVDYDVVIWLGD
jgi:hypothetical protein